MVKYIVRICSFIGLVLTLIPSIMVFNGIIEKETHFNLMVVGLLLWFLSAPFWLKDSSPDQ